MKDDTLLRVKVVRKNLEADGIASFELEKDDASELPPFTAGSHIEVALPGELRRQYSLCNAQSQRDRYLIAVLREAAGRGGSVAMHDLVNVGDVLSIGAPRNLFALDESAERSLLLAGGIGITPILSMAERLQALGAPFKMHYCCRTKSRAAFVGRIASSPFAPKVQFHYDDGDSAQAFDLAACLANADPRTHLYVCGPKGFMDAVLAAAAKFGWDSSRLHYEFFTADAKSHDSDQAFEVELKSSGRVIVVPRGTTVVRALDAVGVQIAISCEQGTCGTCLTYVLAGRPDHRDTFLTPDERAANDQFTPCCSRSLSPRLVLDL
jgi:vanillate O-demethylase ferredoxin subunit